jgi:hypothetical protein
MIAEIFAILVRLQCIRTMLDRLWGVEAFAYNLPRDHAWLSIVFQIWTLHKGRLIEPDLTVSFHRSPHLWVSRRV